MAGATGGGAAWAICIGGGSTAMHTAQTCPWLPGSWGLAGAGVGAWLQPSLCAVTAASSGQASAAAFQPSVDNRPSTARSDRIMRRTRGIWPLYAVEGAEATVCWHPAAGRELPGNDQHQDWSDYPMIALQPFRSRNSPARLLSSPDTGGGGSSRPPVWTSLFRWAPNLSTELVHLLSNVVRP